MDRRPLLDVVGPGLPAGAARRLAQRRRAVPLSVGRRVSRRGHAPDQRLDAGRQRRQEAAGARLDARRRLRLRIEPGAAAVRRREPRAAPRRRPGLDEPSPQRLRLPRPVEGRRREVQAIRQRRHAGSRGGARVGARQRRQLRRRSRQRHDLRAIRRRPESQHAARHAGGARAVPQGGNLQRFTPSPGVTRGDGEARQRRSGNARRQRSRPACRPDDGSDPQGRLDAQRSLAQPGAAGALGWGPVVDGDVLPRTRSIRPRRRSRPGSRSWLAIPSSSSAAGWATPTRARRRWRRSTTG